MEIVKSVFQSKSKRYQFIRYCTVGTLAAGIHYGVYYLLQEYEMTNLNIAYTIGYVTSFICNFFLNRLDLRGILLYFLYINHSHFVCTSACRNSSSCHK